MVCTIFLKRAPAPSSFNRTKIPCFDTMILEKDRCCQETVGIVVSEVTNIDDAPWRKGKGGPV